MGNVVKFPGSDAPQMKYRRVGGDVPQAGRDVPQGKLAGKGGAAVMWFLSALRLPLFLLLYWLRLPLMVVCKFLCGAGFLAFGIAYFVSPMPKMLWGFGLMSFGAFAVLWVYDFFLMMLSPTPMTQSL